MYIIGTKQDKDMNILFFLRSIGFGYGGVEVVSIQLANKFFLEGHNVVLYALHQGDSDIVDRIDKNIPLYIGHGNCASAENIMQVREILLEHKINVAINQMGLPILPIKVLNAARENLDVTVVSFYHNDPCFNGRISDCDIAISKTDNRIKKLLWGGKRFLSKLVTQFSMRYVYEHSDYYAVLSDSYKDRFTQFTGIKHPTKLLVQTNPVTIDVVPVDLKYKQKEVIYCGRIDSQQKRVHRLIDAWALIYKDFPEWKLTIVGDGVSRKDIELQSSRLELKNVQFEGFRQPFEYYKRASVLALTSEYEGFPLVLAECMSFGVVPVVYDSFSAVYDIIDNGVNGVVVPKVNGGFSAEAYAECLRVIMKDDTKREYMELAAIETSRNYSIDFIYQQWMKIFDISCWSKGG